MGNNNSGGAVDIQGPGAQFVQSQIAENCVMIFSKSYCPACRSTKGLFNKLDVNFNVVELDRRDDGDAIQDILQHMTGARTVPRVFVNGRSIGGNSETKRLYDSGKLQEMVKGCPF